MELSDAARAFLDAHAVGHLATASADGEPHVIPLCYARLGDRLYFVADDKPKRRAPRRLKRLDNIAANSRGALVVDDYDAAPSPPRSSRTRRSTPAGSLRCAPATRSIAAWRCSARRTRWCA